MGGLHARMRWTHLAFGAGSLALAGFFLFSGWFSKENLLGFGTVSGPGAAPWILYVVGVGVNVLTGLYAFRLYFTVFQGEPQTARIFAVKEAGRRCSSRSSSSLRCRSSSHGRSSSRYRIPCTSSATSSAPCSRDRSHSCSTTRAWPRADRSGRRHRREPHRHRPRAASLVRAPTRPATGARAPAQGHPAALLQQVLLRRDLRSRPGAAGQGCRSHRAPRRRAGRHGRLGERCR